MKLKPDLILIAAGILTLTLLLFPNYAADSDEKKAEKLIDGAEEALAKGDYRSATELFQFVVDKYPDTSAAQKAQERIVPGTVLRFQEIQMSGPIQNRVDVVFVAEGYTNVFEKESSGPRRPRRPRKPPPQGKDEKEDDVNGDGLICDNEQALFDQDVKDAIERMLARTPYKEYANFFNFYKANVISAQCGCDAEGIQRNTAFDGNYFKTVMSVSWDKMAKTLQPIMEPDITVCLVQRGEKGSADMVGRRAVVGLRGVPPNEWGPEWGLESLMHEFGHAIGKLGEEYSQGSPFAPESILEPAFPNVTTITDRNQIKWKHWIDAKTPIPTEAKKGQVTGPIGLYEGASSVEKGYYRPSPWCTMRGTTPEDVMPYCLICREAIILEIYDWVCLIEKVSPPEKEVILTKKDKRDFQADILIPVGSSVRVDFLLEGEGVQEKDKLVSKSILGKTVKTPTYAVSRKLPLNRLPPGTYTLTVTVHDETEFVRYDPEERLTDRYAWKIVISE